MLFAFELAVRLLRPLTTSFMLSLSASSRGDKQKTLVNSSAAHSRVLRRVPEDVVASAW